MKITVTKRNIKAAQQSEGLRTPVEVAVQEMDCFEDIRIDQQFDETYALYLDGETIVLPSMVQTALKNWFTNSKMKPLNFDLQLHGQDLFMEDEGMMMDIFDDTYDTDYGVTFV